MKTKRLFTIFTLLLLCISSTIFAQTTSDTNREKAKQYLKAKDYKKAIEYYHKQVNYLTHNGEDFLSLGYAYEQISDYSNARDYYSYALKYYQEDKKSLSDIYSRMAECRMKQRTVSFAIEDFNKAIEYNANGNLYFQRGRAYATLLDYNNAKNDYMRATAFYQSDARTLGFLYGCIGDTYRKMNDYTQALENYTLSINTKPDGNAYLGRAALYYSHIKEYQKAIDDYEKAIPYVMADAQKMSDIYYHIASSYRYLNNYPKAIEYCNLSLEKQANGLAFVCRAKVYSSMKDYAKERNDYMRATAFYQNDSSLLSGFYKSIGKSYFNESNYKEAIESCDQSINYKPNPSAHLTKAGTYENLKQYDKSIVEIKKAIPFYENNSKALSSLYGFIGNDYLHSYYYTKAIDYYTQSIANNPTGSAYWNRAKAYFYLKEYQKTIADYSLALPFYQDNKNEQKRIYYYIARAYRNLNNTVSANLNLKKTLELDLDSTYYSAISYCFLGEEEKGYALMNKIIDETQEEKNKAGEYYNMACIKAVMGDEKDALKYLDIALKNGYDSFDWARNDTDMESLWNKQEFKDLLAKYENK